MAMDNYYDWLEGSKYPYSSELIMKCVRVMLFFFTLSISFDESNWKNWHVSNFYFFVQIVHNTVITLQ